MIVDINIAHKALLRDNDPDFRDIYASLFTGKMPNAKIVYGGHLTTEYIRSNALRRILIQLDRAGRARRVDDKSVNQEAAVVTNSGLCRSDDQHIIALARVGNVRLLCSHDTNLHTDFKNKDLLSNPRGKVYQNSSHNELLRIACQ
jgi:hypothetical protein